MKTNEKKSVALLNFFGCRANRIKNSFKKPSKKLFGKLGLFLIFGVMFLNLSISSVETANRNKSFTRSIDLGINEASAIDWASVLGSGMFNTPEGAAFDDYSAFNTSVMDANDGTGGNIFIDWILVAILNAMSSLLDFSGKLLDLMLKQEFFDALIKQNSSIYKGWTIVRDTLNIFFMILLLFSAFATIFQVEKYHIRKVIIMLIVMALLVNFSFPIAGFIIDFSNSAMYYLIELTAPSYGATQSGIIMRFSSFGSVLKNVNDPNSLATTDLILSIIFHFIIFITFISIALNLLIRNLAFAILLILSPAGFAFAFFPDTKGVANSWWSALFKYAFLGPIMVFFLYVAVLIFDQGGAMSNSMNFSGSAMAFSVPIVFLWMGLIISNKFGGDGAGVAMNMAKRTGSWAKSTAQGAAVGAIIVGANATGVPGGVKQKYNELKGGFAKTREDREAKVSSLLGSSGAANDLERKRYKESLDKMKNFSVQDLKTEAQNGNIAAAEELLNRKSLDQNTYEGAIKNSKQDQKRKDDLTAKFKGANKESRIDVVAGIDARSKSENKIEIDKIKSARGLNDDDARKALFQEEIHNKITKLNSSELSKQDFESIHREIERKRVGNSVEKMESKSLEDSFEKAFTGLSPEARADISKSISGNQRAALKRMSITV